MQKLFKCSILRMDCNIGLNNAVHAEEDNIMRIWQDNAPGNVICHILN